MKNKLIAPALLISAILLTGCNKSEEDVAKDADAITPVEDVQDEQESSEQTPAEEAAKSTDGEQASSSNPGTSTPASEQTPASEVTNGQTSTAPVDTQASEQAKSPTTNAEATAPKGQTNSATDTTQANTQTQQNIEKGSKVTMNLKDVKDFAIRDNAFGTYVVTFKKENLPAELKDKKSYTIKVNAIEYAFKESSNIAGNFHAAVEIEHATEKEIQNSVISGE